MCVVEAKVELIPHRLLNGGGLKVFDGGWLEAFQFLAL